MKKLFFVSLFMAATTINFSALAHHSFASTFTNDTISVEGAVKSLKFVNPHVLVTFSVKDDDGGETEWVAEGGAASLMRRQGWDADTLIEGDYIKITGNSTRNGSPMVTIGTVEYVNADTGEVIGQVAQGAEQEDYFDAAPEIIPMELADGIPNLTGIWTGPARNRGGDAAEGGMGGGMGGEGGMGGGMGGVRVAGPASPEGIAEEPAYTEEAAALQAAYDPANDPQVQCELPGLVRQAAHTPHPVKIEQFDDRVVISYEEYAGVRTVYFDDRDLVGGEKTDLGQSIARYEDGKLFIESENMKGNLSGSGGYALSDQTTTVETYYRMPDQEGRSTFRMDMAINDPEYLTEPWSMSYIRLYAPTYEFIAVECEKPL